MLAIWRGIPVLRGSQSLPAALLAIGLTSFMSKETGRPLKRPVPGFGIASVAPIARAATVCSLPSSASDETIITLDSGEAVVMIPLGQYESWKETRFLLANPANRDHLLSSVQQYRDGQTVRRSLDELERGTS